jgi:histone-binding protein RBBP4
MRLLWPAANNTRNPDSDFNEHRILIGTNTSGDNNDKEQNYVQIWKVQIPKMEKVDHADVDDVTGEVGGYGQGREKFVCELKQEMCHPGEVNKARYMPQNPDIIATWSVDSRVLIWDRSKHELKPRNSEVKPNVVCAGHTEEGFGLAWSPHIEGQLATASEDRTVRLWDVAPPGSEEIDPIQTWTHHKGIVNDVQYHPIQESWIASASDDLSFAVIDTRQDDHSTAVFKETAHSDAVNCVAFHPQWQSILVTGSADKTIAMWDLRNLGQKLHEIKAHTDAVIQLQWHPHEPAILASGSYDRRIIMHDLSRCGEEQTEEEAEEGPPELYV